MTNKQLRYGLLFSALLATTCQSIGVPNLRVADLVNASEVIAIADVLEVEAIGPGQPIGVRGQQLASESYIAKLVPKALIKGALLPHVSVTYDLPSLFVGYQGLRRGTRLVFLKRTASGYSLADPYHPDLPAVDPSGDDAPGPGDCVETVVHEMLAVVASSSATAAEKSEILRVGYALPSNNEVIAAMKSGLAAANNIELHQRLQGELIHRGDISELPSVAHVLTNNLAVSNQKVWLLYAVGNGLTDRHAIPMLQPLLHSNDNLVREAASQALWHIASRDAVPQLIRMLDDSDQVVRFYAVRALSDIANEPGWGGPGESEFREHEQEYLTHWQNWAKSRAQ